ncbi:hypothetical protein ABES13_21525 [Bacillus pseudomycoides]|nr:hypothetical protein [Bacillus pseudomycoides]
MKMRSKLTADIITIPVNDQSVFNIKYTSNKTSLGKEEVYDYQKETLQNLKYQE